MKRALVASTLAAAALAVAPAGALAQDAGGQQYDDPLAGTPSTHSTRSTPSTPSSPSTGTTASSSGTATAPSPSGTTASGSTGTSGTSTTTPTATAGAGEIPRTGFPVGWLAFAGFLALGGGFALRRAAGFEVL